MIQTRSCLSLAVVALLVVTAGCSGILGGGPDGGSVATPSDRNGPAPGTSGFNATAVENGHFRTLSNASYTTSLSFHLSTERNGENRSVFINRTVAVDRENDRALSTAQLVQAGGESLSSTTYTADGTTAERRVLSDGSRDLTDYRSATEPYDGQVQPVNESGAIPRSFVRSLGTDIDWQYAGTDTLDGDSVARFEASGTNVTGFSADDAVSANVTENATTDSVEAAVLVDERGVVRRFRYTLTTERDGRPVTVSMTVSVSQIGETTVERPDWLSEATG